MHDCSEYLTAYIGYLRGAYHWFHSAHHVTRGVGFPGDHDLYSDIYTSYLGLIDGTIEKAVGLTNVESCAAVLPTLSIACQVVERYPCPTGLTSLGIASTALQVEKDFLGVTEELFKTLETAGQLSLGLNDFLAATANSHETFVYKLQQRMKSEVQD